MKRFLKIPAAVMILVLMIATAGCTSEAGPEKVTADPSNDRIQIAMSFDSFVIERWQRDRDVFVSTAKELGADIKVTKFVRFAKGEGIEKKQEDFAAEIANMVK